MLHEGGSKGGRISGVQVHEDGKASEVTHGSKVVFAAGVGGNRAGLPDVHVDDGKGGRDRP